MSIEVKLELGHRGVLRDKKTVEGFTHDWTVFVRGEEGSQIDFFVEKVVFHLHESFPKPKRVLKEPPYSVSESGYAGFIMPIDVYFRTREEPRKVTFKYDLYLRLEGPPVSNLRIEKLTFQNPSPDFRGKLIKAGGLAGALTGSAAGGSASLSTQACVPPQNVEDHQANNPKPTVAEKKPRSHVPSKDLPSKPPPSLPAPPSTAVHPKPSQPFTDIFGAPIRTKSSPDSTSVKSKDSGHSSQTKKVPSSNSSSSSKDIKPSLKDKESHKSKDSHHANKEPHHLSKETNLSKDAHQSKDTTIIKKSPHQKDCIPLSSKDSNVSKESHHSTKEKRPPKEHHLKEGHKNKDSHHTPKEKPPKESRSHPESKDSKPSKPIKSEKEASKSSSVKRPANTDSHSSHGNVEKKKKSSPASSESSEKSNSHSKHKIKENKNKSEKHKNKSHSHPIKKEEEKSKHKSSPAPQPKTPPEPKEPLKPKANSPFKAPSPAVIKPPSPPPKPPSPPPIVKAPSPVIKPPSPDSSSMDSDSDESHKSYYNKAQYSSPASSISESSLPGSHPIAGLISDHSILSPLSNEDSDSSPSVPKHKLSSDYDLDGSPEYKPLENKPMPKLKKKHHSHHKSSYKSKSSDNYHQGNGSISNDIPMHHSPNFEYHKNFMNNSAYRQELLELQRIIMTSEDRKLLQYIVDLIEETGKYEVTNTTFDFDLCSLDPAIIHKIKLYLQNCDKYISH